MHFNPQLFQISNMFFFDLPVFELIIIRSHLKEVARGHASKEKLSKTDVTLTMRSNQKFVLKNQLPHAFFNVHLLHEFAFSNYSIT